MLSKVTSSCIWTFVQRIFFNVVQMSIAFKYVITKSENYTFNSFILILYIVILKYSVNIAIKDCMLGL